MDDTNLVQEEPAAAGSKRSYTRRNGDDEVAALRMQVARLTEAFEQATAQPEDDDPYPLYEVAGPGTFISRDNVQYPPGMIFRDKTGMMIPNQEMVPLNAAAERNMAAYLATLPDHGALSPKEKDELIPQAGYELRNETFASQADYHAAVMERALAIKHKRDGRLPDPLRMPTRPDPNVPLMSNVRIQQTRIDDRAALGHPGRLFSGGARPTPWPAGSETEVYRGPVPAANKTTPVFGNVQSQPLGTLDA